MASIATIPTYTCFLCGKDKHGYGNNPAPLIPKKAPRDVKCCNKCNAVVLMCRMGSGATGQKVNVKNWISLIRSDDDAVKEIYEMFDGMWNTPDLIAFEEHGIIPPRKLRADYVETEETK